VSDDSRAAVAAAVTVVLWASAFVSIRSAGAHFTPGALALGRLLVASLALGVVWLARGAGWPPRAAWPGIAGSGVLWFGLYMITLNWGEREVDAGTAAMVVTIGPILIALLGGWLRSPAWSSPCHGSSWDRYPGGSPSRAEPCAWPASPYPGPGPAGRPARVRLSAAPDSREP
jgi:hypothetical protein